MKRKLFAGLFISALMLSVAGVGVTNAAVSKNQGDNILIAYFSRVGNTDFPDDIDAVTSASLLKDDGKLYGNIRSMSQP